MNATEFLTLLWGDQPPGLMQLWRLDGRTSHYIAAPDAATALCPPGAVDVYTGVATTAKDRGKRARAKVHETAALAGLWIDLDVNGGPGEKAGAAPDQAAALRVAHAEFPPTIIVNSGYGLHAWWLFEKPWIFTSADDRDKAATASIQWYELHRRHARAEGWAIDSTYDLARLLRPPGTINGKGGGQATVTVTETTGARYPVEDLLAHAATAGTVTAPAIDTATGVDLGDRITKAEFDQLVASHARALPTWEHRRDDHPNWSLSEYDLALCSIAARAGWTDQQMANLITTHRAKYGEPEKANRVDYVQRTIGHARQAADKAREAQPAEQPQSADEPARESTSYSPQGWAEHILDMLQRDDEGVIPIPFAQLANSLDGGLRPGEVCLVCGYTSHGKSIYVDQMADTAAAAGRRVHLYMTEMTAFQRGLRLLARRTDVPFRALKRRDLTQAQWKMVTSELLTMPYGCSIVSDWSVDDVVRHIRANQWDLAVIDLIHGFHYHDERDLSKTSSALVRAAKGSVTADHHGTAVVAAAHLNDGQMRDARSPKRPRPGLHSIKGSSSLKQDADVVMFVWQEDDDDGLPTGTGEVWIAKSRQGELGAVAVSLNVTRMRFETGDDWRGRDTA